MKHSISEQNWPCHCSTGKGRSHRRLYSSPQTPGKSTVQVKPTAFWLKAAGEMLFLNWSGPFHKPWKHGQFLAFT